jgi:hypothetical protein
MGSACRARTARLQQRFRPCNTSLGMLFYLMDLMLFCHGRLKFFQVQRHRFLRVCCASLALLQVGDTSAAKPLPFPLQSVHLRTWQVLRQDHPSVIRSPGIETCWARRSQCKRQSTFVLHAPRMVSDKECTIVQMRALVHDTFTGSRVQGIQVSLGRSHSSVSVTNQSHEVPGNRHRCMSMQGR